jgi:hypothetical protein
MNLRLTKPSLDVIQVSSGEKNEERFVIRGVIDPSTLDAIQTGDYQREIIPGCKVKALMTAARTSVLPDIELGMRGEKYQVRGVGDDETYLLQDDVFVIDGLQRINALRTVVLENPSMHPKIGALIHLNTSFDWERERFRILNQERARLSPNILLRNGCSDHPGVELIHNLCTQDGTFLLYKKVTWSQRQKREELIPAMRVCIVASILHSRFTPGGRTDDIRGLSPSLDKKREIVGPNIMRENIRVFFALVDQSWNIKDIVHREHAPQIKSTFLTVLADLLTQHSQFWNGNRLFVNARMRSKLRKFSLLDPEISRLCGSGGQARTLLFQILLGHINKGRRTGHLVSDGNEGGENDEQ